VNCIFKSKFSCITKNLRCDSWKNLQTENARRWNTYITVYLLQLMLLDTYFCKYPSILPILMTAIMKYIRYTNTMATKPITIIKRWARTFFCLSANSWAHSAVASPQISELYQSKIANPQICNDKSANHKSANSLVFQSANCKSANLQGKNQCIMTTMIPFQPINNPGERQKEQLLSSFTSNQVNV
jgi:hypothetical protein